MATEKTEKTEKLFEVTLLLQHTRQQLIIEVIPAPVGMNRTVR